MLYFSVLKKNFNSLLAAIQNGWATLVGLLLVAAFALASCSNGAVMENTETIKNEKWEYADAKTFTVDITDTTINYTIYVSIRHSFNYEWRNAWVKIETTFPDGRQFEKRVSLDLAQANGQWYGDCLGDNCDMLIRIQENAFFPETGTYRFKISQDMRVNPLAFVKSIGMRIEKYNEPQK